MESIDRRTFISGAGAALLAGGCPVLARAQALKVNFADIGVGDPGDWSKFTAASGAGVNLVAIGNAPSAVVNVLLAGGGKSTYDIINIVGGMQRPLVENKLIDPIDLARIPNWAKNAYAKEYFAQDKPGFKFIGYKGKVYGVPTVLQGDSFAYLPEATGPLDSYGALFDPKFKGYVALEDNYTTAGQKTALYLKANKLASIANPDDMTASEFKTVVSGDIGWQIGKWSSNLHGTRYGATTNYSGQFGGPVGFIGPYMVYNLNVDYQLTDKQRVTLTVNNLLNNDPPRDPTWDGTFGFAPPYYNVFAYNGYGRAFWLQYHIDIGGNGSN